MDGSTPLDNRRRTHGRVGTGATGHPQNPTPTQLGQSSWSRRRGCQECRKIIQAVQTPGRWPYSRFITLWNYDQVRRNTNCSTCRGLVEGFRSPHEAEPPYPSNLSGVIYFNRDAWEISLRDSKGRSSGPRHTLLHIAAEANPDQAIGLGADSHQIDVGLLRTWLHQCNEHHGGDCHSILDPWARIDKIHPLLLVDVQQMCLIGQSQTPEDALYVALSYVWGPAASPFQTLRSNLAQLRTHGALSPVSVGNQLPRTIRDSMVVVQLLGLRYLWVDRLCIVQDDPTTKPHQLASMASIYSNAYFTIAAGEGDADSGLAGLSRDSARSQPFKVFHFSPSCTMIEKSPTRSRPAEGKGYNTRGWTFQEWAFSRRILVFHQQTVSWCCQRLRQQENGAEPNPYETVPQHPGREDGRHSMWTSWPNLETYLDVARRYSERTLGYQEDMLNAFAAFTNVFGRTMTGDMLYGVPELFFHGLLLFTFNPFQKSWRRICANEESSALLPSWSWVAWTSGLSFSLTGAFYQYLSEPNDLSFSVLTPPTSHTFVLEIYKIIVTNGGRTRERIKDLNYWRARQPKKKTDSSCLPKGYEFKCYVPLTSDPYMAPFDTQTPVLPIVEFHTSRIFGNLVKTCPDTGYTMWELEWRPVFFIQGIDGCIIGCIDIPVKDSHDYPLGEQLRSNGIELISIGGMDMGYARQQDDLRASGCAYHHRFCPQYPRRINTEYAELDFKCRNDRTQCLLPSDWTYRFHNVLWIEWQGGVAYRKAIGRVWEEAWEKQEPEETDVVLG